MAVTGGGSIWFNEKRGLWQATIEVPSATGRQRKYIRGKHKRVVLDKLEDAKQDLRELGAIPDPSMTAEKWFTYWLTEIVPRKVRPRTAANYRSLTNRYVIPTIGRVRLAQLGPHHIRQIHNAVLATRSSTTAHTVHAIVRSSLATAYKEGRIRRNPATRVDAPPRDVTRLNALTTGEASELILRFQETDEAYLWATFLLTGARRGEILGLEWDRVGDSLDLSWQLQRHPVDIVAPADYEYRRLRGGLYLTRPKSRAGWRVVPLVDPLRSILQRWRTVAPPNRHGLVFTMPNGDPIDPDYATRAWPNVLKAAGITKKVRLHDARHTTVDLLYETGVSEATIQEIVGHSTAAMTRQYKSRGNSAQLRDAMIRMSELLGLPTSSADSPERPSG